MCWLTDDNLKGVSNWNLWITMHVSSEQFFLNKDSSVPIPKAHA